MLPFIKKYSPKTLKEIYGQEESVAKLKRFVLDYKKQKKKAMFLYGPTGTGKTSAVHALAHDLGLEIVEVNASDTRNQEQINSRVGAAIKQQSLFSKGKIILIDEIDGLGGNEDRGGVQAIIALLEESIFPIIMTATDPYEQKLSKLRSKCEMVEFHHLNYLTISNVLKEICRNEKIKASEETLNKLARRAGGNLRSAINDMQTISEEKKITDESIDELADRDVEETIINALMKIFKTTDMNIAISAFENVDEDIDKKFLWLDENLPLEYDKPADLARAYDALSRADVFKGRIRRWQYWRFLVYINALITAGVASAKDEKYHKFVNYKPTGRLLKLYWAKQKSFKKKAIAEKIAEKTHSSKREVLQNTLPYVQVMFRKDKDFRERFIDEFGIDEEEVEWLRK